MMDRGQFLEALSQQSDQQGKITLLNFYKGVPVEAGARLKAISGEKAVLDVEPPYSICLIWENETSLVLEATGITGQAAVESFDLLTGRVALGKFKAENTSFDRRAIIRVEPRSHIEVAVENAKHRMIEYLADISTKGIGIRIPALESGQVFSKGEAVKVSIQLPQGKTVIPGVIQNITLGEDFYRLGVVFDEGQDSHPAITGYIAHRKDAIFQILKIRYDLEIEKQRKLAGTASSAL